MTTAQRIYDYLAERPAQTSRQVALALGLDSDAVSRICAGRKRNFAAAHQAVAANGLRVSSWVVVPGQRPRDLRGRPMVDVVIPSTRHPTQAPDPPRADVLYTRVIGHQAFDVVWDGRRE